jgi:hypothetical protein
MKRSGFTWGLSAAFFCALSLASGCNLVLGIPDVPADAGVQGPPDGASGDVTVPEPDATMPDASPGDAGSLDAPDSTVTDAGPADGAGRDVAEEPAPDAYVADSAPEPDAAEAGCISKMCPTGYGGDSCSGAYPNGCGATINCSGDCKVTNAPANTCGGGGTPSVCGCPPGKGNSLVPGSSSCDYAGQPPCPRLNVGDYLVSPNCRAALFMQSDGNLVLYRQDAAPGTKLWSAPYRLGTSGCNYAIMQGDGNFVLKGPTYVCWASGTGPTYPSPGAHLVLQDNGDLVLYGSNGSTVLWDSSTMLPP